VTHSIDAYEYYSFFLGSGFVPLSFTGEVFNEAYSWMVDIKRQCYEYIK